MKMFFFRPTLILVICFFVQYGNAQFLGRNDYKQYTNDDFVNKINLVSESFDIGSDKLISPIRITSLDNYLVVQDLDAQKHIHLIDLTKNEYIGQFIGIGKGSKQLTSAGLQKNGKDSLVIYDNYENKFFCFDIKSLVTYSFNPILNELENSRNHYFINYDGNNKKLWYAGHYDQNYRFYEKNIATKKVVGYGKLLEPMPQKLSSIEIKNHLSAAKVSKYENNLVFAYEAVPLIEVFNTESQKLTSAFIPHREEPFYHAFEEEGKVEIGYTNDSLYEYLDVKLTDKYIYVVYRGQKFMDTYPKKSVIYVLDYDLNPIKLYFLDKEVTSIAVYNNEIIYGINIPPLIPGQKGKLLKYNLK